MFNDVKRIFSFRSRSEGKKYPSREKMFSDVFRITRQLVIKVLSQVHSQQEKNQQLAIAKLNYACALIGYGNYEHFIEI
jgi:hypothetical protein